MTSPSSASGRVLSRLTRPQLLFWPASEVATLFGAGLHRSFADAAASAQLAFTGIVARPLYKCNEVLPTGEVCMKVASMSPFLTISADRFEYQCTDCMAKAQGAQVAPGSASAAHRCLYAYPTVVGGGGKPTPLRVGAVACLLAHAPPDTWGWRASKLERRATHEPAASPQMHQPAKGWHKYTTEESHRIWMASSHFQGEPPVMQ